MALIRINIRNMRKCAFWMAATLMALLIMVFAGPVAQAQTSPAAGGNPTRALQITDKTFKLQNPVLKGFYPDPSIIRVDSAGRPNYYLINSTFSYFPGIPVFHSSDMVHWKQIGNVINRPTQMNFLGARLTRGLFAPSISYHNGLFYVVCTQIDKGGNFVVTAKNPTGPWSDPVFLPEVKGIDPSLYFDRLTDKAYLVYNGDPDGKPLYEGHRAIRMVDFDYKNLRVTGTSKVIVNGGVNIALKPIWIEGPHLMERNGWYYLYAAEGGTSVNHSEVVFRSKKISGPFSPYSGNPILTQRNLPENRINPITSAGHAQFVKGPDGKTYAFFLAVRPYENDYYNTGRETFVAPVKWVDNWPVVNTGNDGVQYTYAVDFQAKKPEKHSWPLNGNFTIMDSFKGPLDPSYLFLRTIDSSSFKTAAKAGSGLLLKLKPETILEYGNPAFIGRRQQHLYGSFTADFSFSANNAKEKAGVVVFQNERHFYYACKSVDTIQGQPLIQLYRVDNSGAHMELMAQKVLYELHHNKGREREPGSILRERIAIQIKMQGKYYSFYYKATGDKGWQVLKDSVDARPLSTHVAGGFIGCIFGLYGTSQGQHTHNSVLYHFTRYTGADKTDSLQGQTAVRFR